MSWLYLVIAGMFEIVWAYAMKQSHGFTRLTPLLSSLLRPCWLQAVAMRNIPLGTAYTIWTGNRCGWSLCGGHGRPVESGELYSASLYTRCCKPRYPVTQSCCRPRRTR